MHSRTLRRARWSELQAYHKAKLSREVQPIENQTDAVAVVARLRAMIPCSTDPAWLERMAREVESKAHLR